MDEDEDELLYAVTFPAPGESAGPEVPMIEQLTITRKGREHLKNVPIDSDHAALIVGWYEERVARFVSCINSKWDELPDPPDFIPTDADLTSLTFKDALHERLGQLGSRGFSNIIAPCTQEQIVDTIFMLGEIQRHPFMQAVAQELRQGPLAVCGTCLSNRTCEVIPLKLFMPPPHMEQIFS